MFVCYSESNDINTIVLSIRLRDEQTRTTGGLDFLFRQSGEEFRLDNDGNVDLSVSEELEVSSLYQIDDGGLSSSVLSGLVVSLSGDAEDLVEVDRGAVGSVLENVELTHTDLTKVTRVIFIHKNSVVVLSSGVTSTTGMLSVLSDTSVTGGDVSSLLAVLMGSGRHDVLYIYCSYTYLMSELDEIETKGNRKCKFFVCAEVDLKLALFVG